ncbi:hypothetical protein [Pseudokineococcus sp. 5B2Z-1]|uniref:hypothetical protein n=1 Tax=Pseudokineococcus sp. 5B2Z-1 TaxID=3132744 RepID=UPI0030D872D9
MISLVVVIALATGVAQGVLNNPVVGLISGLAAGGAAALVLLAVTSVRRRRHGGTS